MRQLSCDMKMLYRVIQYVVVKKVEAVWLERYTIMYLNESSVVKTLDLSILFLVRCVRDFVPFVNELSLMQGGAEGTVDSCSTRHNKHCFAVQLQLLG